MAHELTSRKNGFIEFAAVGSRKEVWHGLGQYVTQEELNDIETAKKVTGMDWEIFTSPVMYQAFDAQKMGMSTKIDSTRNVLFRSDNHEVLSVMSADYKIVQPLKRCMMMVKRLKPLMNMRLWPMKSGWLCLLMLQLRNSKPNRTYQCSSGRALTEKEFNNVCLQRLSFLRSL